VLVGLPAAELLTGIDRVPATVPFVGMKVTVIVQVAPGTSVPQVVVRVKLLEFDVRVAICRL
jgi:hypothetical protein